MKAVKRLVFYGRPCDVLYGVRRAGRGEQVKGPREVPAGNMTYVRHPLGFGGGWGVYWANRSAITSMSFFSYS